MFKMFKLRFSIESYCVTYWLVDLSPTSISTEWFSLNKPTTRFFHSIYGCSKFTYFTIFKIEMLD